MEKVMFGQLLVYNDPLKLIYKINPHTSKMYSLSSCRIHKCLEVIDSSHHLHISILNLDVSETFLSHQ